MVRNYVVLYTTHYTLHTTHVITMAKLLYNFDNMTTMTNVICNKIKGSIQQHYTMPMAHDPWLNYNKNKAMWRNSCRNKFRFSII